LDVWQRAIANGLDTYRLTSAFPRSEAFALTSQLRRAATSVAANIAEGHARRDLGDYLRHLSFARGSVAELETLLELALGLDYLSAAEAKLAINKAQQLGRMLSGLARSLRRLRCT
jgi:four helix bundle protein